MTLKAKNIQPIIIAGGKGTRLGCENTPKPLTLLKGKPIIAHLLKTFSETSFLAPVLVVGYKKELFFAQFPDEKYVTQKKQLGTGHAVLSCETHVSGKADVFILIFGDSPLWTSETLENLVAKHVESGLELSAISVKGDAKYFKDRARVIRNPENQIVALRKLKSCTPKELLSEEYNADIFICNDDWLWQALNMLNNDNIYQEYNLADIVEISLKNNKKVQILEVENWWETLGINTPEQLKVAEQFI